VAIAPTQLAPKCGERYVICYIHSRFYLRQHALTELASHYQREHSLTVEKGVSVLKPACGAVNRVLSMIALKC